MTNTGKNSQRLIIIVLAAVFLAATYIAMGYAVCAGVPFVTEKVAAAAIDDTDSPFGKKELVEGAVATRDYSFGSHDISAFGDALVQMNQTADTPYADTANIFDAPAEYTVTEDAIAHLDDVYDVSTRLMMPILGIAALAAFLLFGAFRYFGIKTVPPILVAAGCVAGGLMIIIGAWALISFDSFFAVLHSLFFAQGSWVFPADSLLITMLPESFWAGIGGVWLTLSVLLAALSVLLGVLLRRRTCK